MLSSRGKSRSPSRVGKSNTHAEKIISVNWIQLSVHTALPELLVRKRMAIIPRYFIIPDTFRVPLRGVNFKLRSVYAIPASCRARWTSTCIETGSLSRDTTCSYTPYLLGASFYGYWSHSSACFEHVRVWREHVWESESLVSLSTNQKCTRNTIVSRNLKIPPRKKKEVRARTCNFLNKAEDISSARYNKT